MAAPTPSTFANRNPGGSMMNYGYRVIYAIIPTGASQETIEFEEITVTPPGVEGGDAINVHTQYSDDWLEKVPSILKEMTPMESTVAYDPAVYTNIVTAVNAEGVITIHFPFNPGDSTTRPTLAFYGYLKSFIPGEMAEDGRPTASVTIQPTNRDPALGTEEDPVFTAGT